MRWYLFSGLLVISGCCFAQQPIKFVMPHGTGFIPLDLSGDWHPAKMDLYDDATRPVIQISNIKTHLEVSYLLFPNPSTAIPSADACREAVVPSILQNLGHDILVKDVQQSTHKIKNDLTASVGSYLIASAGGVSIEQKNVFGFWGDAHTCAEIHISLTGFHPTDQPLFDAALKAFDFSPNYTPTSLDYAAMGSIFYRGAQQYADAAVYYQRALDTEPTLKDHSQDYPLTYTRYLTDQLAMSYGMSGDIKRSRAINEAAIARDPLYPMYYYNLACADAETGNAAAAHTHLEQAYARRENVIPGEAMPDAEKDDSILKLKSDASFWAFVQSLPKPKITDPAKI